MCMEHARRETVTTDDVVFSLKRQGRAIYGFGGRSVDDLVTEKEKAYGSAIFTITKQVHPDCQMSKNSMLIMNSFVNDILDRMLTELTNLSRKEGYTKKNALGVRDVQTVVRLMLPGELNRHAISEATKAVGRYSGGS